jgi:regulator of RNase E activity RraA/2-keto-4-pentenoate hydratase/2-oxohepta-3-ene-1,7-dioic acid hydratase in catechol pathway
MIAAMEIGLSGGRLLVPRPSKVIAVHLSYASRAAERGWRPEFPSYFLKPPSSIAEGGGDVVRPEGCELLAFEGEIALVIGEPARSVSPEEGFGHVAYVTAANDLGVYDLRYADRGSNLRSKGADGFTPVGPRLLDARQINPSSLALRTWLNGQLVQEAAIADELLFPLGMLVADLSRLMTLERGDLILTGTPTGSTVAKPGDVIEVEVSAGIASTGRLRTRVVAADAGSLPAIGAMPRQDEDAVAAAYGGAQGRSEPPGSLAVAPASSLAEALEGDPPEPEPHGAETVSEEVVASLGSLATATIAQQLRRRGLDGVVMVGLQPTRPDARMVGRARTLRYLPGREDLTASRGAGMNAQKQAVEGLRPGEVLVIEARGEAGAGTIGDILALRAATRGAAGIVTDGPLRDAGVIRGLSLPVFHAGTNPAVLGRKHVPWETDVAIACAGVLVEPGDLVVGDADGVVVVPGHVAAEVAKDGAEQERQERFIAAQIAGGASVDGLFPLGPSYEEAYRQWCEKGEQRP